MGLDISSLVRNSNYLLEIWGAWELAPVTLSGIPGCFCFSRRNGAWGWARVTSRPFSAWRSGASQDSRPVTFSMQDACMLARRPWCARWWAYTRSIYHDSQESTSRPSSTCASCCRHSVALRRFRALLTRARPGCSRHDEPRMAARPSRAGARWCSSSRSSSFVSTRAGARWFSSRRRSSRRRRR